MILARCPACATTFRVRPEQLRARQGRVRCGQCQHAFNALEALVEDIPADRLPEEPHGDEPLVPAADSPVFVLEEKPAETAAPAPTEESEVPEFPREPVGEIPAETGEESDAQAEPFVAAEPEDALALSQDTEFPLEATEPAFILETEAVQPLAALEPDEIEPVPDASLAPDVEVEFPIAPEAAPAAETPPETVPDTPFPAEEPEAFVEPFIIDDEPPREDLLPESLKPEALADAAPPPVEAPAPIHESPYDKPFTLPPLRALRDQEEAAPIVEEEVTADPDDNAPPLRQAAWAAGATFLTLALVAQAVLVMRGEIVQSSPELRPAMQSVCDTFGCSLPLPRDASLIAIESSDIQPDATVEARFTLYATLRNRANFQQDYPFLEITLTDSRDKALVRRVLEPKQWLPAGAPKDTFPANREIPTRIVFDAPGVAAAGYRVYAFYP